MLSGIHKERTVSFWCPHIYCSSYPQFLLTHFFIPSSLSYLGLEWPGKESTESVVLQITNQRKKIKITFLLSLKSDYTSLQMDSSLTSAFLP